jgi:primosomal protein N' (replication factor Y)
VEQELRAMRPNLNVAVMTSDTADNPAVSEALVRGMEAGEIQVLIGTQMIAKGYHFPKLRLVGVVDADLGLSGEDLRASERSFQLLHQVSGRAGREEARGSVLLQTYNPEHPVMKALIAGDRQRFYELELEARKAAAMPPFGRLASVLVTGRDSAQVHAVCLKLQRTAPHGDGVQVFGPAPAPISLLRGQHRMRFLLKAGRDIRPQTLLNAWLDRLGKIPSSVAVRVDIDPQSFA